MQPDFRAVFDASARPLLLIANDPPRFTMLAVNPAHAQAFGTTPRALTGRGVFEVFPPDPDPMLASFVDAIRESFDRVLATRAPDQMPVRPYALTLADGTTAERFWRATNTPILRADGCVTHILSAVQDVTGEVLERRGDEARRLLMREVDHRARNALAIVQSFVRLTTADDVEAFRRVVEGRVEALARAQTSLANRRWEGADLADVIGGELEAMAPTGSWDIDGPAVLLRAEHVQAMSMAIHEFATNAGKYGALSAAEGRLSVAWTVSPHGDVRVDWRETGGPPVTPPERQGFGSRLIASLVRQLDGEIDYDWRREGLAATLRFCLRTDRSN